MKDLRKFVMDAIEGWIVENKRNYSVHFVQGEVRGVTQQDGSPRNIPFWTPVFVGKMHLKISTIILAMNGIFHSTVTLLARFRAWSTSAIWMAEKICPDLGGGMDRSSGGC